MKECLARTNIRNAVKESNLGILVLKQKGKVKQVLDGLRVGLGVEEEVKHWNGLLERFQVCVKCFNARVRLCLFIMCIVFNLHTKKSTRRMYETILLRMEAQCIPDPAVALAPEQI
jgi:hypothetical protein